MTTTTNTETHTDILGFTQMLAVAVQAQFITGDQARGIWRNKMYEKSIMKRPVVPEKTVKVAGKKI